MGYIPNSHRLKSLKKLKLEDIESESVLVLEDGHCLKQFYQFAALMTKKIKSLTAKAEDMFLKVVVLKR